jgi:putative spermidine/putrescine transport system permease protein
LATSSAVRSRARDATIERPEATTAPRRPWRWLGRIPFPLIPFIIFCIALEIVPLFIMTRDSLRVLGTGAWTFKNYGAITEPLYWHSLRNSILLAGASTLTGGAWGALLAVAILRTSGRMRRWLTGLIAATSNFSGIPLALAAASILGINGFVTLLLKQLFDYRLYPQHFTLYSWTGLLLVYTYFQLPLMVLLFAPSISRLKVQWQEASATLGAPAWVYWIRVGIPVMMAPFLAALALLFASGLGAYATAWEMTGGQFSLLTIQIAFEVNGDISYDPGKASALSLILAALMAFSILAAQLLSRRTQKWLN